MKKINTVLGTIRSEDLGFTLIHEHIFASFAGWECDPLCRPYHREKIVGMCVRALEPVKPYGIRTIVDATPADLSRDVDILKEVSEKLQINIICSTGRYTEAEGKWAYLKQRNKAQVGDMRTELYEGFMREITEGIGNSGVRPGVIKVATGLDCISPVEEAVLKAAAQASKETGIPVITHTEDGTMGPEQAELLVREGLDPKRIVIGHMCGNPSIQYQLNVLEKGVGIAFDRFGLEIFIPDSARTAALIDLLSKGYAARILMSQDFIASSMGRGGKLPEETLRLLANWSFVHIVRDIIPALKQAGVTEEQIRTMTVDNPRRLLGGE
jgi:phosphotriesterase-related protein